MTSFHKKTPEMPTSAELLLMLGLNSDCRITMNDAIADFGRNAMASDGDHACTKVSQTGMANLYKAKILSYVEYWITVMYHESHRGYIRWTVCNIFFKNVACLP